MPPLTERTQLGKGVSSSHLVKRITPDFSGGERKGRKYEKPQTMRRWLLAVRYERLFGSPFIEPGFLFSQEAPVLLEFSEFFFLPPLQHKVRVLTSCRLVPQAHRTQT